MSTITTINASDQITDSRAVINTNFANLNTGAFIVGSSGEYTTIQSGLDAVVSGGGTVYVTDGTYTITSTLLLKVSRTRLIVSDGATIQCNGGSVTTLIKPNSSSISLCTVIGGKWLQTSVTAQGVAFDFSDSANNYLAPTRIEEFATAFKFSDTANNTFYNLTERTQVFNCNNGIELSGTLANNNTFNALRIRPKAGGAGKGIAITDSRGNIFTGCNIEPATGTGITGVHLISSSGTLRARENTFLGCWLEENAINVQIDADCVHNTFLGCTFAGTGGSAITDNSTANTNSFINCNANGGDTRFNWIGDITDRNRNELIKFTETASAINELTIANAGASSRPSITASGDDSNIGINLIPKGSGTVVINGSAVYYSGGTDVALADGGTGASTAAAARANLLTTSVINFACANTAAPADANTYYFGFPYDVSFANNSAAIRSKVIPFACVLRGAGITVTATAGATTEATTIYARINNTTDVTLSSAVTMDQTNQTFSITGLSQAIAAGDKIEIKLITPTWVTNPTNVRISVDLYLE